MASGVKRRLGTLFVVVVSSVCAVLLAEGALRLVLNPADFLHATLVEDPVLGRRILPLTTGHDALGFRNREVPARASVVAIGDSFTYGVTAPREGSWPHQLSGLLGESVYNMGLGGFGPLQYLHLAQVTAKPLSPRLWVVGFYFGNDLMDAYYVAHGTPYWSSWRLSDGVPAGADAVDRAAVAAPRKRFQGLRDWLSRHSLLYSVLRVTVLKPVALLEREHMVRQTSPDVQWSWSDPANGDVRTVFTPQGRLAVVDLETDRVREGMKISQRALSALQSEADLQGVRLIVVLIPTKERAFCTYLRQARASLPSSHDKLCDAEAQAKAELVRSLDANKIRFADPISALEEKIAQHVPLYPADSDGHFLAAGYGVLAQVVADAVRRYAPKP